MSIQDKKIDIFNQLLCDPKLGRSVTNNFSFPMPYCEVSHSVKAIVLGADPSNPQGRTFEFVFGLENRNSPYFSSILKNLNKIDLNLNQIYVQNLCPNYFSDVTDKNDDYIETASKYWLPVLKEELDTLFQPEVPVFITAWKPLVVVEPRALDFRKKKSDIYKRAIIFNRNKLDRPVIALFRGGQRKGFNGYYDLKYLEFSDYLAKINALINK